MLISLKYLAEFPVKLPVPSVFFLGKFEIKNPMFLIITEMFSLSVSFCISCSRVCFVSEQLI